MRALAPEVHLANRLSRTQTRKEELVRPISLEKRTSAASKAVKREVISARLKRLRKNSPLGRKAVPQGLKPSVFSITYGTTKVVP